MGVEKSASSEKGKEFFELEMGKNLTSNPNPNPNNNNNNNKNNLKPNTATTNSRGKKSKRRNNKKAAMVVSPVQKLYDTCKEVFAFSGAGVVPSPENIERVKAILDDIKPDNVGLNANRSYFCSVPGGQTPVIRYLHLFEDDKFSMGIFCLPPSGVLPLHNHPGMTVFSKLVFGTLHIKSYDWVNNASCGKAAIPESSDVKEAGVRLAKVKVDSDFTAPCNTSILYPADGGNMHCLTAVTACAVLDVLVPPYSDPDGRHCTYYLDFPFSSFTADGVSIPEEDREGYAWLQEREKPEDLTVVGGRYLGPKIVQ